jgi:hypothetical protein
LSASHHAPKRHTAGKQHPTVQHAEATGLPTRRRDAGCCRAASPFLGRTHDAHSPRAITTRHSKQMKARSPSREALSRTHQPMLTGAPPTKPPPWVTVKWTAATLVPNNRSRIRRQITVILAGCIPGLTICSCNPWLSGFAFYSITFRLSFFPPFGSFPGRSVLQALMCISRRI